jgi:hypothetical protein
VLAGVLLGLAAGAIWTVAQPDRFRAEARVLIRGTARGLVPAVKALAESSLLEQNVAQTLRLAHPPSVSATGGEGGVVTLSVEAGSRDRARQLDGEAAIVLTRLVVARFGPGVEATILDPAHPVEQTSPTPGRNFLLAGLLGLTVGAAIALARRRPAPRFEGAVDPGVERRLQARIDAVTKRERALARRAGELAEREARLQQAERELAVALQQPAPQPEPEPEREPEPAPEPQPEPEPIPEAAAPPLRGGWTLDALEDLVREHGPVDPAQYEEWMTYLFFLREHAALDGTLPPALNGLVNEVFGTLVERGSVE